MFFRVKMETCVFCCIVLLMGIASSGSPEVIKSDRPFIVSNPSQEGISPIVTITPVTLHKTDACQEDISGTGLPLTELRKVSFVPSKAFLSQVEVYVLSGDKYLKVEVQDAKSNVLGRGSLLPGNVPGWNTIKLPVRDMSPGQSFSIILSQDLGAAREKREKDVVLGCNADNTQAAFRTEYPVTLPLKGTFSNGKEEFNLVAGGNILSQSMYRVEDDSVIYAYADNDFSDGGWLFDAVSVKDLRAGNSDYIQSCSWRVPVWIMKYELPSAPARIFLLTDVTVSSPGSKILIFVSTDGGEKWQGPVYTVGYAEKKRWWKVDLSDIVKSDTCITVKYEFHPADGNFGNTLMFSGDGISGGNGIRAEFKNQCIPPGFFFLKPGKNSFVFRSADGSAGQVSVSFETPADDKINLVKNPGFEKKLTGWADWLFSKEYYYTTGREKKSGDYSCCFESAAEVGGSLWQSIRLSPRTKYILRFSAKADGSGVIVLTGGDNSVVGRLARVKNNPDWVDYRIPFTTGVTADITLRVTSFQGKIFYDDFFLAPELAVEQASE